ncbi:MAG TPA: ABC-F family ATP-binding cassette domain-containing protein, partial [Ignavibacteriales bacterium]|nr:ABC-F family ATP-binding cassette domain-containing protein [Ignavibacteriales bacterium]
IDLINVSMQFSGEYLFKDVNIKINAGDRVALVGSNGSGKSTLLKIIFGLQESESGKILKQRNIKLGYLPQDNISHKGKLLFEEVKSGAPEIIDLEKEETRITQNLLDETLSEYDKNELSYKLGEVHYNLERLNAYSIDSEIEKILIGLGFNEADFERRTDEFSGGWQMRIALAKLLLANHDLLLLDEPTNHLDIESLEWLIDFLKSYRGAILLISHDKHFVNSITNRTLEIYLGTVSYYNGNYDKYLNFKRERDLQLEALYAQQQRKIKETEKFIERFRYKATKARQVQSRIKQLEKIELIEIPDTEEEISIRFPEPPKSGAVPMELKGIRKSYGGGALVLDGLDLAIERGDKIAFLGVNGAGKTTLAKIIAGKIDYDFGEKIIGHNTQISYYAQDVADSLNPELDILETIEQAAGDKTLGQLRTLLGSFLFKSEDVFKKVGVLSGGEKSRTALAKMLLEKANLIILDEPTNHLDISSKAVLQKALIEYTGSIIIVSHDVDFLAPIVNKVLEIKDKKAKVYPGGVEYYLLKKKESRDAADNIRQKNAAENLPTKKDKKRQEAELRQKKFHATKGLVKDIQNIESRIEIFETRKKNLENELLEERVYANPQLAKEKNAEYTKAKLDLENALTRWSELSDELERIEKSFSNL